MRGTVCEVCRMVKGRYYAPAKQVCGEYLVNVCLANV